MAQSLLEKHRPASGLKIVAHAGYAARGIVYFLIGALALMATFGGTSGQTTGAHGALRRLLDVPGGRVILGVVAAGLVSYAVWRLTQGLLDADGHGASGMGLVVRIALLVSGVAYFFLAFFAVSIITGWAIGGDESSGWIAQIMAADHGRWLVGVLGLLVIGVGVAQCVKGFRAGFLKYLDTLPNEHRWAVPICRVGLMARGLVFCIIGVFLIIAAWQRDAGDAKGLGSALSVLQGEPFGTALLAIVAVGLLAFSLYSFIEAGYRRVGQPKSVKRATPGV